MTRGQRKVHVLLWLILGPIALVGLVLAVAWRPVLPVQDGVLPGLEATTQADADGVQEGRP